MFGLQLDQHDINHMYSLCGKKRSNYYLKVRDMRVRLISCLSDSNKNSAWGIRPGARQMVYQRCPSPSLMA